MVTATCTLIATTAPTATLRIEIIDDQICDDVIVIHLAEDGHPAGLTIPASATGKRIPIQGYIEQMRKDCEPLARALARTSQW